MYGGRCGHHYSSTQMYMELIAQAQMLCGQASP